LTDQSTKKKEKAMINPDARYELKDGTLLVNDEPIPLRKGAIYRALARAGWRGLDGTLPPALVESMLRLDRRVSLLALSRDSQPAA
jgi:hypothetical protein